jgi:hypothetical protein
MMKFSFPSIFNILYSIFCGSLFSDLCPLKPKSALTPETRHLTPNKKLTYRVGTAPPHHKAPG